jgi:hypothetical protein
MFDAECVERIVRLLAKHLTVIVSVKIRIFPKLEDTLSFCKMLENAGCQLLTVMLFFFFFFFFYKKKKKKIGGREKKRTVGV